MASEKNIVVPLTVTQVTTYVFPSELVLDKEEFLKKIEEGDEPINIVYSMSLDLMKKLHPPIGGYEIEYDVDFDTIEVDRYKFSPKQTNLNSLNG